jgi:ubiquinone/menaquinone biosynthesis C-methylase UbiE
MQRKNSVSNEKLEKIITERMKDRLIDLALRADNTEDFSKIVKEKFNCFYENIALSSLDLGVRKGKVLDFGTQFGLCAIAIAKQNYPFEIVSLQDSLKAINIGENFAEDYFLEEKIKWVRGSSDKLPFADHSFDLVVSAFDMHHWENPVETLNEINRILKTNGALMIADFRRDAFKPLIPIVKVASYLANKDNLYKELKHSFASSYLKSEVVEILNSSSLQAKVEKDLQFVYIKKERPLKKHVKVEFLSP